MHLLNVETHRLEEYFDDGVPPYAILSHTWDADEVLYRQICGEAGYAPGSSAKVDGCCAQAARDGLRYVWIDTCCIDKSSSAELSEAINSMFGWYRRAAVCYAFLADVPDEDGEGREENRREQHDGGSGGGVSDAGSSEAGGAPSGDGGHDSGHHPADGPSGDDDCIDDDDWTDDIGSDDDPGYHRNSSSTDTDTDTEDDEDDNLGLNSAFAKSRWFTRGWTLQELLAPDNVVFFSASWSPIGRKLATHRYGRYARETRLRLASSGSRSTYEIHRRIRALPAITGIPKRCLDASSPPFARASVAQKMSWAAGRQTMRREDRAYSLLGIFGINMPLLYGEGDNAFVRLQEEILRLSDDLSLLAWGYRLPLTSYGSNLLAKSPDDFAKYGEIYIDQPMPLVGHGLRHYTMTNKGLHIALPTTAIFQAGNSLLASLGCVEGWRERRAICLPLLSQPGQYHYRDETRVPESGLIDYSKPHLWDYTDTYIAHQMNPSRILQRFRWPSFSIFCHGFDLIGGITEIYPKIWTRALKKGLPVEVEYHYPEDGVSTIVFLYEGGELPRFIAKFRRQGGLSWSCVIARMPDGVHTLHELVVKHLDYQMILRRGTGTTAALPWYEALDHMHGVLWCTTLYCAHGTRLSVQTTQPPEKDAIIKFAMKKTEPEAGVSRSTKKKDGKEGKTGGTRPSWPHRVGSRKPRR